MRRLEQAGVGASLLLGGGVILQAVRTGGKWAIVKTVAQVAASGAVAHATGKAVEHSLRAAGASEETIHGVRLAAEVVTWLLLLRRVHAANAKSAAARASQSKMSRSAPRRPEGDSSNPGIQGSPGGASHVFRNSTSGDIRSVELGKQASDIAPTRIATETDSKKFTYSTAAGRRHLSQHFQDVVQDPSNVVRTFTKRLPDRSQIVLEVRESLLAGPGGFLKIESTWQLLPGGVRKLTTIIPLGG